MTKTQLQQLIDAVFAFGEGAIPLGPWRLIAVGALEAARAGIDGPGLDALIAFLKSKGIDVVTVATSASSVAHFGANVVATDPPPAPSPLRIALAAQAELAIAQSALGKAVAAVSNGQSQINAVVGALTP